MEKTSEFETNGTLNQRLDYESVFGQPQNIKHAANLIKGIPSIPILVYIASINFKLYLNDSGEQGQQVQNIIIKSLLLPGSDLLAKIILNYQRIVADKQWPAIFYRYSNLLFYELVFNNYNPATFRSLSVEDVENILKAYLVINGTVNAKIKVTEKEITDAFSANSIENVLLPQFIYQNDYKSNVDLSNQVTRAFYLFEYLNSHVIFKEFMPEYYSILNVKNENDLIYKLLTIFTFIRNNGNTNPVFNTIDDSSELHNQLLIELSINLKTFKYKKDDSFRQFRNQMFLRTPNQKFMVLDVSFLIDFFYKTQIFKLSAFFGSKGLPEFLSVKATEFTERIYLKLIMERCFPTYEILLGNQLIKKDHNELTDVIIQSKLNILLIEFKDTLLKSSAKNSADKETLFDALDAKFLEDEGPKGIQQLYNAIDYMITMPEGTSNIRFEKDNVIYPVVIYTDNVFGYDGINKIYKEKFNLLLDDNKPNKIEIRAVTFINLNFFEINENYLANDSLNIFSLIRLYHQHTEKPESSIVPFEVFAKVYRDTNVQKDLDNPKLYKEISTRILTKQAVNFE